MKTKIENIFRETAALHQELVEMAPEIQKMLSAVIDRMRNGGTLYILGNGGSAADAQHIAGELIGRFKKERKPIPAAALNTDSSVITAIANDYGTDQIFARQVRAYVDSGDVVLAISTSGNSPNILKALKISGETGALNVGLSGKEGGDMAALCKWCLCVPHTDTPRIQEAHQTLIHIICEFIEDKLSDYE